MQPAKSNASVERVALRTANKNMKYFIFVSFKSFWDTEDKVNKIRLILKNLLAKFDKNSINVNESNHKRKYFELFWE
jgi:hypothetical protein